jgi:SulP family sulfate permease
VPINVPALGVSTNKDDIDVNRELVAHGISNAVSGLFGAVQSKSFL